MSEEKAAAKEEESEQSDDLKQAQEDSLSPEQKHENYLKTLERLHNEP